MKAAIVGGGPSGIYCALTLADTCKDIAIEVFEKHQPLKTLLSTGGGRCNLTYDEPDFKEFAKNYPRGEKFLYSVFSKYFSVETLEYFKSLGIETYVQEDMRVFPVSNSSKDTADKMLRKLKEYKNVRVVKKEIKSVKELEGYDKIVIACGSKGGYELAKAYGHTVTPLASALCGYITEEKYPSGVVLETEEGAILFTHQGISGPWTYKYSSLNAFKEFPFEIEIPLVNPDELFRAIKQEPKKAFSNVLSEFIPKSLARVVTKNPDAQACHIKKDEILALKALKLRVLGTDNKGETVKAGGVSLKEVSSDCCSKINPDIYFIGEILDIDGFCGGFNLQNCWSTGAIAAKHISSQVF